MKHVKIIRAYATTVTTWHRLTLLAAMLLAVVNILNANPITRQEAQKKAAHFMQQRKDTRVLKAVDNVRKLAPRRAAATTEYSEYYVFNKGNNEGYVIVSGDDRTIPVLGYCDEGNFDYAQLPPNMQFLLDSYASQIEQIQRRGAAVVVADAIPTHAKVDQLLTCTWSQGYPYNMTCPDYFGLGRSVTGCVATAMAQILYYHRDKSVTEVQADIPGYTTWTEHPTFGRLKVEGIPAGSPIDWANMKDNYNSASDLQRKAVANLMHYCGVSVKMDYTNSSSGAQSYEVYNALRNYFGYGSSVRYVNYTNLTSDADWDNTIYAEIAARRPVYISGSNQTVGHAFVCDGYDGNQRYHINWGWGGQSNGYYYLTNLTPGQGQGIGGSDDGYNGYKEAVIGIEPENYGEKAMNFTDSHVKQICLDNWDANHDGKFTYNEAAAVTQLGTAFKGATTIKKFQELYYFTSLTTIADDAFNGCSILTSVRLPRQLKTIGQRAFMDCPKLEQLELPSTLSVVGAQAFSGCKTLTGITLPEAVQAIEDATFKGCSAMTSFYLPVGINKIGNEAFAQCAQLKTFTVNTYQPADIQMGTDVFKDVDLQKAILNVLQGTKDFFLLADQWKAFGTIFQSRELSGGVFSAVEAGKEYYIYNVGLGRYLTMGEAWGTQAIVGTEPLRFKVNRSASMADGVYYLTCENSGKSGKIVYRTSSDGNVGNGVKAVFVDGTSLTSDAYWTIAEIGNQVYTMQIPSGQTGHVAGQYWGVQTSHASNAAVPTYGVYSDIDIDDYPQNCQWKFVLYDEAETKKFEEATALLNLINLAKKNKREYADAQAVYDNLESTLDDIKAAQSQLRSRLQLIEFVEPSIAEGCIANWDLTKDGELSFAEAAQVADFTLSFQNSAIKRFDEFRHFAKVPYIYGNTFDGCRGLESIIIPAGVEKIYYQAFRNCSSLTSINLPERLNSIGNNAFLGCSALKEVTILNPDPTVISVSTTAFNNVDLSACTLYVPFGSKAQYAEAAVWKNFGNIVEVRGKTQPKFSPITLNTPGYIFNLAQRKYIAMGEAYGTQAVVASRGLVYQFMRSAGQAEDLCYLYCEKTGKDGKYLFRVTTDEKVGDGVKSCFADGSLSTKAYWQIVPLEGNVFRLHVPTTDEAYVAGHYLGINESHASGVASPTYGLYWDVRDTGKSTQWAFITEEDMKLAKATDDIADRLLLMLERAAREGIDASQEQAVYDSAASTYDDLADALASLRGKLHLIDFADAAVKAVCLDNWDADGDEELSWEEAASVDSIGTLFRDITSVRSFEELRYFTSLTEIPENAFRGDASLLNIAVPASVKTIGKYAFFSCSDLKYLVLFNESDVVERGMSNIPGDALVFVPAKMQEAYKTDDSWNKNPIEEYTGKPVVTAEGSKIYGRNLFNMTILVKGAPVNGVPAYVCPETESLTAGAGEYPVVLTPGTITTRGVEYRDGIFTIEKAKLRVKVADCSRPQGTENPAFTISYAGFRNRETESVLTKKAEATCEATKDSPAGTYAIVLSGAEADNYTFEYVNGTLTVTDAVGIRELLDGGSAPAFYDLQGRRVVEPKRGIYMLGNKKVVVK